MVKGCQRRIIHLKNTGSVMFEEAYFILNDKYHADEKKSEDMVREANRIIEENLCREGLSLGEGGFSGCLKSALGLVKRTGLSFAIGAVAGSVITALVILL